MRKEIQILDNFIKSKGLRYTSQREKILSIFLATEKHLTIDQLYRLVRKKFPDIGYTTVYRTMHLLVESGLCRQINVGDGVSRFEHNYNHQHHDHLVCIKCNRLIEVVNNKIERMQVAMARAYDFVPTEHRLDIFGICKDCFK
jgi:Fur family ferric uptake transcriptional regulator